MQIDVVNQIYKLRKDFIVIGLTGRTGSGCSTVANILGKDVKDLKSNYEDFREGPINNDVRKNRIIFRFISENWKSFKSIKVSDVIFYYALLLDFDKFKESFINPRNLPNEKSDRKVNNSQEIGKALDSIKKDFDKLHEIVKECDSFIEEKKYNTGDTNILKYQNLILEDIPKFRNNLSEVLAQITTNVFNFVLQCWGNMIRKYNQILPLDDGSNNSKAPACLAHKINMFIKAFRALDKKSKTPTLIVIDALRNPYEVLYFRERYSAFYLMSVNIPEEIRQKKLFEKGYRKVEVENIDKEESGKHVLVDEYSKIDIDACIELSDIHLAHDGTGGDHNRDLINQIFKYLALILHPGLVSPSPLERCMQVAYTAKLNSGCLSRQVGAAVTNEFYSIKSVGWNTVAEGQTPCTLRSLFDLVKQEDKKAFSKYEKENTCFYKYILKLAEEYKKADKNSMGGLTISYCFKDIHNTIDEKQNYNQVHTRSLHAEENAFLQLAKYGSTGIRGGKLFTTASCCELCAKKAYQLGIKEIYYIDSYPGISQNHILESGDESYRPKMILFRGAIGRAYINLYNPFIPMKDEINARSNVSVKHLSCRLDDVKSQSRTNIKEENGTNNKSN